MLRRTCTVPGAKPAGPIARRISRQASRPQGLPGRLLARLWITETAAVNDHAFDLLAPVPGQRVLEIGFGPGRALSRIAAAGAEAVGVEVSDAMLTVATRRNAASIAAGHMQLHHSDGITLPVPDSSVDAVLAVHTVYFWPDPRATLADAQRVLRPGGRIVLALRTADHPLPRRLDRAVYRVPTTAQAVDWLRDAGFVSIEVHRRPDLAETIRWITADR